MSFPFLLVNLVHLLANPPFTREFAAFTRKFPPFTRELMHFTREFPPFTREFDEES
ncbi:hypothetical protein [Peribacillus frigoritolerans]|uniref:Uncharacterized protein n=1 Tax=Peribacillus frigoritolerans TaxID=450367 RepID=A0AAJ1QTE5_9BACI|nr:hypothetical protein [Peribacillus frigoritolerans]MDM5287072.1 hypothetical protein [Peribacillus frigoritolerans]